MSGAAMGNHPTGEWVSCPRCPFSATTGMPDRSFNLPGAMAAHLAQDHGVSASVALSEARKAFGLSTPAPTVQVAPRPVPAPPAAQETPMPRKDAKPKYKRPTYACGACGGSGHTARSPKCPKKAGTTAPKAAGRTAATGGGSIPEFLRAEITKREREIAALKDTLAVLGG